MISERLNTIIHMIRPCRLLADIGCDHGYVCIQTVREGTAESAIAADVAPGPLKIAADNIRQAGLEDRIRTSEGDGLESIPEGMQPDCVNITGMGGLLMKRILGPLKEGRETLAELKQLVLGPQSDLDAVRRFLIEELSYTILREVTVLDDGKFYVLLDVLPGREGCGEEYSRPYSESEYLWGKFIDPDTADVRLQYLEHQKRILEDAYRGALKGCAFGAAQSLREIKDKLALIDEAIAAVRAMQGSV